LNETLAILSRLVDPQTFPARLATLVKVDGSSYRRAGARLLLDATGARVGSISGGCLEEDLLARMRRLNASRPEDVVTYDTTSENDLLWGVGTGCHGVVVVVLEYLPAPPAWAQTALARLQRRQPTAVTVTWGSPGGGTRLAAGRPRDAEEASAGFHQDLLPPHRLVICGAGDDARALVRLAKGLGWTVCLIDPRAELVRPERWPEADETHALPADEVPMALQWDDSTAAVIMTHHYRHDLPLLAALLPLKLSYLGLLGPRLRADRLLADLPAGVRAAAAETPARLSAPVGLDLGGDGPEAVALSILAEIQARFAGRSARPLRQRDRGIHDR